MTCRMLRARALSAIPPMKNIYRVKFSELMFVDRGDVAEISALEPVLTMMRCKGPTSGW